MPNGDYGYEYSRDAKWARQHAEDMKALLASACLAMQKEGVEIPRIVDRWWQSLDHAKQSSLIGRAINMDDEREDD
jgi:hypothetical protein